MKLHNILQKGLTAAAFAVMLGFSSCNYLDVVPPEQVGVDDAMGSHNNAKGFLFSCYNALTDEFKSEWTYGSHLGELCSTTDDVINPYGWVSDPGNNGIAGRILLNNQTAANANDVWGNFYDGIGQSLLFLEKIESCDPLGKGYITSAEYTEWKAEAKALIAYYHYFLLRRYGPIVLLEEKPGLGTPSSGFNGRCHFDYCVDWIADKLDEAAEDLPATRPNNEIGRMTSTICKAVKANLYLLAASPLWNGSFPYSNFRNTNFETPGYGLELVSRTNDPTKWQRAYDAADEAIKYAESAGQRAMFTDDFVVSGFDLDRIYIPGDVDDEFRHAVWRLRYMLWCGAGEGNTEGIHEIYGQKMHSFQYPLWPRTCQQSDVPRGGYGANSPMLNAVFAFLTKDGYTPATDPNFLPESEWYKAAGLENETPDPKDPNQMRFRDRIINLNVNREPRFYAWLGFDGGDYSIVIRNGYPVHINLLQWHNPNNVNDIIDYHGYDPEQTNRDNCPTGYYLQKFQDPRLRFKDDAWAYMDSKNPTIKCIRLAEMYLNRAEAAAQLGKTDQAISDVNVIRARAGVKPLTSSMIGAGGMSLLDWVLNERRVEFFAESHRYFDIRRYVAGEKYLGYGKRMGLNSLVGEFPTFEEFNKPISLPYPYTWANRLYLSPIPQDEVYANPQCVQNPGY